MNTKSVVMAAVLGAAGIALQFMESYIPLPVQIPGGKLGLGNIATLVAFVLLGARYGFAVALVRTVGSLLAPGGGSAFIYSLGGAVVSALVMLLLLGVLKQSISLTGVGMAGAFMHNLTQVLIAAVMLRSLYVLNYLPVLGIISVPAGFFTGAAAHFCIRAIRNSGFRVNAAR